MPDNPNVPAVLAKAKDVVTAQQRLRDSMAAVAAEVASMPPPLPAKPAKS